MVLDLESTTRPEKTKPQKNSIVYFCNYWAFSSGLALLVPGTRLNVSKLYLILCLPGVLLRPVPGVEAEAGGQQEQGSEAGG